MSERLRYQQMSPHFVDRHEVTIEQYEHCVFGGPVIRLKSPISEV